jgi:hypothetical protein
MFHHVRVTLPEARMRQDPNRSNAPTRPVSAALSRRTVFAGAGVATAAAAAAALLPRAPASPAVEIAAASAPAAGEHGRYEATAHVQHYYRTARV